MGATRARRVAAFDGSVYVVSDAAGWEYRFRGEAPAFRPDGTLTFLRNGQLFELTGYCRPRRTCRGASGCSSAGETWSRLSRTGPTPRVKEIVWFSQTRMAAVLAFEQEDMVAVYEGRRLLDLVGSGLALLRAQPQPASQLSGRAGRTTARVRLRRQ